MNNLIEQYLKDKQPLANCSVVRMRCQLNKFLNALRFQGIENIEQTTLKDIQATARTLYYGTDKEFSTYCLLLEARAFFTWKFGESKSPFAKYRLRRCEPPVRDALSLSEVKNALRVAWSKADDSQGFKNALMLQLQFDAGLRTCELTSIKLEDIGHNSIRILGKETSRGKLERLVQVTPDTMNLIQEYVKDHRKKPNGHSYLFVNKYRRKVSTKGYSRIIREQIGLKITGYQLRHSFATLLHQNGADTATLSKMMGHRRLDTLNHYIENSAPHKQKVKDKFHPLNQGGSK